MCYNSLEYWHLDSRTKDTIIYQLREVISSYQLASGIQATNVEDLKRYFELKADLKSEECREKLAREDKRKRRWRKISGVLTLTTLAEGVAIYFLVR